MGNELGDKAQENRKKRFWRDYSTSLISKKTQEMNKRMALSSRKPLVVSPEANPLSDRQHPLLIFTHPLAHLQSWEPTKRFSSRRKQPNVSQRSKKLGDLTNNLSVPLSLYVSKRQRRENMEHSRKGADWGCPGQLLSRWPVSLLMAQWWFTPTSISTWTAGLHPKEVIKYKGNGEQSDKREDKPHQNHIGGREWKAKVTRWVSKAFTAHLGNRVRAPKLRKRLQSAGGLGDGRNDSDVIWTNNEALSMGDNAGSETHQWVDSFLQQVRIR